MQSIGDHLDQQISKDHALSRLLARESAATGFLYTPREIVQQPWLWRETAARLRGHAPALKEFVDAAGMYDADCPPSIVLTGAGTSDYVGLSLADLMRRRLSTTSYNWPTTRITAFPDAFLQQGHRYLICHFARSGDSPESTAVLHFALKHLPDDARHVVITCNGEGALAKEARQHPDRVYLIVLHEASNDRGLAMTSSFTNMVVAGQGLTYLDDMDTFCHLIDRTADAGTYLIDRYADGIYDLVDTETDRVFFLGNVDQLGAATESALKAQEMTAGALTAVGEDTLALRHGPISAVHGRSMVGFFLSANRLTQRYEMDVVRQFDAAFHKMGAKTVVVGERVPEDAATANTTYLAYDPRGQWNVPPLHQVNLSVLFGQMYGLFSCYRRGMDVDNPAANKALYSRTVQGVTVYDYEASRAETAYGSPSSSGR